MKNMLKLGLTLAMFATIACVMLAFVYAGTSKQIEIRQKADLDDALQELFPNANFEPVEGISSPDASVSVENAYRADRNGTPAGAVLRVSRAGYGGPIKMMVGVGVDGKITGVKILQHTETPGLGANAASPSYFVNRANGITFYGQFKEKSVNDRFAVKEDVTAITASTITSKAVSDAVKAAGLAATAWFNTGANAGTISSAGGVQ